MSQIKLETSGIEKVFLQPFGDVALSPNGSIAYVHGNAAFLSIMENGDTFPIRSGQCLPVWGRDARLINPFSYPVTAFIGRGLPVNLNSQPIDEISGHFQDTHKAAYLDTVTVAGRKKGIGFIAKRGRFRFNNFTMTANDQMEVIQLPNASWRFAALRPAGMLAVDVPVVRMDGTVNTSIIGIAGTFTEAEITTWKASAGYTQAENRMFLPTSSANMGVFSDTIAMFVTVPDTSALRVTIQIKEMGEPATEYRVSGVGGAHA